MNKTRTSLYTVVAVALLSTSAFASNPVLQNPTLIPSEGAGAFVSSRSMDEHYGIAPAWNIRRAMGERMENPTLIPSEGAGAFISSRMGDEHYGIAPAWGDRSPNTSEMRLGNPTLQAIFDNVD